MIKFDLEKALAGDKVVTRDGREVTQLVKFNVNSTACIYCVIDKSLTAYNDNGLCISAAGDDIDLFMAPKQLSGFVNIYTDRCQPSPIHATKEIADEHSNLKTRIACIDLSQFEEGHGLD